MDGKLVSVIVPVYNVERYICHCVESIIDQTYTNIEIFLVDDGSPDRCGKICDNYAQMDHRIKVIHKENGGLSDARNVAIDIANGEYITFVDSDDYIAKDYIQYLVDILEKNDADISGCCAKRYHEGDEDKDEEKTQIDKRVLSFTNQEALEDNFYQKHILNNAWGKVYKRKLFEEIRYPVGRLYEDLGTTYKLISKSKKIVWGMSEKYFYLQRDNSIMTRKFSINNMDRILMSEELLEFTKQNFPEIEKAAISRNFVSNMQVLRELPLEENLFENEYKLIENNIRKFRAIVLKDKKAKKINRVIALFSYFPVKYIQFLGRIYKMVYK